MSAAFAIPTIKARRDHKLSQAMDRPILSAPVSPINARFGVAGPPLDDLAGEIIGPGVRYIHKYRQALSVIVYSFLALKPDAPEVDPPAETSLCLPRTAKAFHCPRRYRVNDIGREPWVFVIDWLCRRGYLEVIGGGFRGKDHLQGLTTAYAATDKLKDWMDQNREPLQVIKLQPQTETIRLTGEGKKLIDYQDTEVTEALRQKMQTINTVNQRHRFEIPGAPGLGWYVVPPVWLEAQRVFRDDFQSGGRVFYPVQNLTKAQRQRLRIDGSDCVELDYSSHQPRMLYHLHGLDAPDDCYAHPEIDRQLMKSAMVKVMNCGNQRQALGVVKGCLEQEATPEQRQRLTQEALLQAVWDLHPLIKEAMSCDLWKRLQYLESCIAIGVMGSLALLDRPCLGVHDSFVVAEQDRSLLQELMIREYRKVMGGYDPRITEV